MATVYVSYRSTEQGFVQAVMSQLEARHDVRVDYKIPVGVDWRGHQLEELRRSDVLVVFVSQGSAGSDFQNAEIGGALFSSAFLDGKLIVPVLLDDAQIPRTLDRFERLDLRHRDALRAAAQLEAAIVQRRHARVRLFISHAHKDAGLAKELVETLEASLDVPKGALRCTSVPGYKLDLGTMAPDALRRELGSAACVIALLTPNSIANEWVLFELGATWANATLAIPLLAGGLQDKDLPGALRGAAGGSLADNSTLDSLFDQLATELGWRRKVDVAARDKQYDFVEHAKAVQFQRGALESELKAGFSAKRARIGPTQGRLLHHVEARAQPTAWLPQADLARRFPQLEASLYYRLEQLRLLGFLDRENTAPPGAEPAWRWGLAVAYREEIGR